MLSMTMSYSMKFILGMYVPHDEYMNLIVLGRGQQKSNSMKPCKHDKSIVPSLIKFKFSIQLYHDEYTNPIDFGRGRSSFLVKN